jgi:signal transduction histidine kinase
VIDHEAATANLFSDDTEERLAAARYFSRFGTVADVELLNERASVESVSWVRRALEAGLERLQTEARSAPTAVDYQSLPEPSAALVRSLAAEAVEEVSGTILHEFSPIVGALKLTAQKEFVNFKGSQTERFVEQLSKLLRAIRHLRTASAVPKYTEVNLSHFVKDIVALQTEELDGIDVHLAGPTPFIIHADVDLLNLAITNGLRNACEAIRGSVSPRLPQILFNWGRAGPERWLVMMDSGPGFSGNPLDALKMGVSNKEDHFGYGLATAQYAMRSMDGEVILSNRANGEGACFELRWFKDDAYTVR